MEWDDQEKKYFEEAITTYGKNFTMIKSNSPVIISQIKTIFSFSIVLLVNLSTITINGKQLKGKSFFLIIIYDNGSAIRLTANANSNQRRIIVNLLTAS